MLDMILSAIHYHQWQTPVAKHSQQPRQSSTKPIVKLLDADLTHDVDDGGKKAGVAPRASFLLKRTKRFMKACCVESRRRRF
jgi:hypothetical protein